VIPQALYSQGCMLADQSKKTAPLVDDAVAALVATGDYYYDLKWDGCRMKAYVTEGVVQLINRNEVDATYRYPEIVEALGKAYAGRSVVLDGEVICLKDGVPAFDRAHKRDAQGSAPSAAMVASMPATYMVFDLIYNDWDDLRQMPYMGRRGLLQTEAEAFTASGLQDTLQWSRSEKDGATMWEFIKTMRLEGLIAKHRNGRYTAGRGAAWIKLKPTMSLLALVAGFDAGKGARASTFGNLHLVLLDSAMNLVPIGKVGTGFNDNDLRTMLPMLQQPTGPLIVEVEYQEVSTARQLRFPVFKGIRTDVVLTDCTIDQLDQ
jgi:bifunctional non-homologous end joining protein LigD